jgi:prepilin peptidase CpaA
VRAGWIIMASLSLLVVFPFLMAYAAVRDLLTMLIPNTV